MNLCLVHYPDCGMYIRVLSGKHVIAGIYLLYNPLINRDVYMRYTDNYYQFK